MTRPPEWRTNINPDTVPGKHIPQRTCIACRTVKAKRELVRLVHTPSGNVEIDLTGRNPGRGAYLCRAFKCWDAGLKGDRLEYVLRCNLPPENRERLLNYARDLQRGSN